MNAIDIHLDISRSYGYTLVRPSVINAKVWIGIGTWLSLDTFPLSELERPLQCCLGQHHQTILGYRQSTQTFHLAVSTRTTVNLLEMLDKKCKFCTFTKFVNPCSFCCVFNTITNMWYMITSLDLAPWIAYFYPFFRKNNMIQFRRITWNES